MKSPIRLFLLHSYRTFVDCLKVACDQVTEVVVAGSAGDPREALRKLSQLEVDVVLFEAELDRAPVRPKLRRLKRELPPHLKILPLGVDDPREIVQLIEAGAYGCVSRRASFAKLIRTVQEAHREKPRCSPQLAARLMAQIHELVEGWKKDEDEKIKEDGRPTVVDLTDREQEVLELMHLSNKEIAAAFRITENTVKIHVHNILGKMKVVNRVQARERARELGLLVDEVG